MNKELLIKTDDKTQLLIKSEAEKILEDLHNCENLMTSKINNFIKYSFTVFIALISYSLDSIYKDKSNDLIVISVILSILFVIIMGILFKSIFPKKSRLLGAEPNKLVTKGFLANDNFDSNRIIINRIMSIQIAIDVVKESYNDRLSAYKTAYKLLLVITIISLVGLLVSLVFR